MEPPAARLEVVSGKGAGMSVLVVDELLIGRNAEGAGRLADDDEISRTHARVSVDSGGRCVIEDLGSTNGTFVNGRRISEPQSLAIGDKLELGATVLLVQDLPAPPALSTGLRVEPTVINAPLPTALPGGQEAPTPPDAPTVAPTAVPAPAEPIVPDTAATPVPTQPPSDAPPVEPTAVPAPAEPDAPTVEPTAVPPPPEPDAPPTPSPPVAPPSPLKLEVDFEAGEVRIATGHDSEPIRLVFEDGNWRPATG